MASKTQEAPLILIAEDDHGMRLLVSTVLRWEGYRVHEARDGHDLLERLGSAMLAGDRYDAVVSDVRMPGRSGLDVLRGLSKVERRTPFILVTAFGDEALHESARTLGAFRVVDKPFALETLVDTIRELLGQSRRAS